MFLKPEEDPEREKELCQRSTSQRNWKKEWNWQFIRLKIKPVWRAPLPTLQGSRGPGEGREGVQCVIWLRQLAHFTDKETELQTGWAPAKSLGCQGGQGKFQPMLFCLQGQTSHYTTHSAEFKDVRAWPVLCLLAFFFFFLINDVPFQLQKPPSIAVRLTWFDISSTSPDLYLAVFVGPHSSRKLTHVSGYHSLDNLPVDVTSRIRRNLRERGRTMTLVRQMRTWAARSGRWLGSDFRTGGEGTPWRFQNRTRAQHRANAPGGLLPSGHVDGDGAAITMSEEAPTKLPWVCKYVCVPQQNFIYGDWNLNFFSPLANFLN